MFHCFPMLTLSHTGRGISFQHIYSATGRENLAGTSAMSALQILFFPSLTHCLITVTITTFKHQLHPSTIQKAVPLAIGHVSTSNPLLPILDTLSKYSHDNDLQVAINAIFAMMGLVELQDNKRQQSSTTMSIHQCLEAATDLSKLLPILDDIIVACLCERFMMDMLYTNIGASGFIALNPHRYISSNANSILQKYAAE